MGNFCPKIQNCKIPKIQNCKIPKNQNSTSTSSDDSFERALNYSSTCLDFYEWISKKFAFQVFTYRQVLENIQKENSGQWDVDSAFDRKIIKSMLKTFVEVKMLKYYKDGYFTIPLPTLSFEITETSWDEREFLRLRRCRSL